MKAIVLAQELQKLADALRQNPDAEISKPWMHFSAYATGKDEFKNMARMLPRPLKKSVEYANTSSPELELKYVGEGLEIHLSTLQSNTCRLVSPAIPAKYECESILSPEEDAELEQMVGA